MDTEFPESYWIEQIKELRKRKTNFIFLFGRPGIGKSAITASLIHYLNTECDYGSLEKNGNPEGQKMLEVNSQCLAEGRFPGRNIDARVFEIETIFVPSRNRTHLSKLSLTFLEMGGQKLAEVSITKLGRLPANIDVYLDAGDLSLTFILVTSCEKAVEDDQLMVNFLEYIIRKSSRFREARVLLLISKWDTYTGESNITDILKRRMPRTFRKLSRATNGFGVFSLGRIEGQEDDAGGPRIVEYDPRFAKRVFEWLYQTLSGKQIG